MNRSSHPYTKGYLLIEAMVAIAVLTTGVLGIFALMSQSIKLTRVVNDQYIATYLAAEGIEIAKNLLDANIPPVGDGLAWNAGGFDASGCYEMDITSEQLPLGGCPGTALGFDASVPRYAYGVGSATPYVRRVTIEPIDNPQIGVRIVSTVAWAGGSSSVSLEDKFYDWHR